MIKRFNITVLDGQCLAAMSAHSEGSYARYADIAHLLEEKTIEQHQAEFARWYCKAYDDSEHVDVTWTAWCAARRITE